MRLPASLALALVLAGSAQATPLLRGARTTEPLRLVFLDADERAPVRQAFTGDASLDVGRVSGTTTKCTSRGCIVQRRFRLRVEGRSRARFVSVRASVDDDSPGQRLRIDGRLLSTAPLTVEAATPLDVAVVHTVEIEISATEPEGLIARTVLWTVEDLP